MGRIAVTLCQLQQCRCRLMSTDECPDIRLRYPWNTVHQPAGARRLLGARCIRVPWGRAATVVQPMDHGSAGPTARARCKAWHAIVTRAINTSGPRPRASATQSRRCAATARYCGAVSTRRAPCCLAALLCLCAPPARGRFPARRPQSAVRQARRPAGRGLAAANQGPGMRPETPGGRGQEAPRIFQAPRVLSF